MIGFDRCRVSQHFGKSRVNSSSSTKREKKKKTPLKHTHTQRAHTETKSPHALAHTLPMAYTVPIDYNPDAVQCTYMCQYVLNIEHRCDIGHKTNYSIGFHNRYAIMYIHIHITWGGK